MTNGVLNETTRQVELNLLYPDRPDASGIAWTEWPGWKRADLA